MEIFLTGYIIKRESSLKHVIDNSIPVRYTAGFWLIIVFKPSDNLCFRKIKIYMNSSYTTVFFILLHFNADFRFAFAKCVSIYNRKEQTF